MSRLHRHTQGGTALITALVILVGLVLLGLPFLFSQSASRAGAASFAAGQAARAYLVSAQNLGLALAIYTQEEHWQPNGTKSWTALGETLKDFASATLTPTPELLEKKTPTGTNQATIDLRNLPGGTWNQIGSNTRIGLELSDESGRLDMNSLGFTGWQALLQRVGLGVEKPFGGPVASEWADWDDNEVYDNIANTYSYSDGNPYSQLVDAIMDWRVDHRFSKVDDLLLIDPRHRPNPSTPGGIQNWRPGMTRAEVEKLRPFLTVHAQGQGRLGLLDVGNVVTTDTIEPGHPWIYADPGTSGMLVQEGFLRAQGKGAQGEAVDGFLISGTVRSTAKLLPCVSGPGPNDKITISYTSSGTGAEPFALNNDNAALMTTVAPTINGHALTPEVGYVLDVMQTPLGYAVQLTNPMTAPQVDPLTGMAAVVSPWGPIVKTQAQAKDVKSGGVGRDLRLFTTSIVPTGSSPRATIPLEWASYGLTRITVASQVTDLQGHPAAHHQRTVVVQALPQEDFLERRWLTQGALQSLVDQRFASQAMTLPNPVDRALDQTVDDPLPSETAKTTTGITAKPLANFTNSTFLPVDWQAVFGAGTNPKPSSLANALGGAQGIGVLANQGFTDWTTPTNQAALENDGLHLSSGSNALNIAWQLTPNGPLGVATDELTPRHLSGWVCPTEDWGNNDQLKPPVILLEARSATLIPPKDGTASSDHQNLIQLAWDPKNNLLILSQASPAAEYLQDATLVMAPEAPRTSTALYPLQDPRSLATGNLSLAPRAGDDAGLNNISPLLRTSRISVIYRMPAGFPIGQWRHIQIILGGGQPGGLGLLVDGIAGRDLTLTGNVTPQAMGDHALVPSLVLDKQNPSGNDGLPLVDVLTATDKTAEVKKLMPVTIVCKMGPLAADLGIKAAHYFPGRGVIRIDDEYISYDGMSQAGTGTAVTFTGCRRGVRQDTNTGSSQQEWRWPGTQAHAPESLVIPGSFRAYLDNNGTLYGGMTHLTDPLPAGDATVGHNYEVWGKFSVPGGVLGDNSELTVTNSPLVWPGSGIIKISGRNDAGVRFDDWFEFKKVNSKFKLTAITPVWTWNGGTRIVSSLIPRTTDGNDLDGILCSIQVNEDPTGPGAFPVSGYQMLQVMDNSGRIEWLLYESIAKSPDNNFYFTYNNGLNKNYRGQERTVFDPNLLAFPSGTTTVLPVQKDFQQFGQLLVPGDVITLVPSPGVAGVARQLIVRYAANDGYGDPNGSVPLANYDTNNGLFAFSEGLGQSVTVSGQDWQVISGVGWGGGINLTKGGSAVMKSSAQPRLDRMGATGAPGRLAIGSGDGARGAPANSQKAMIIDGWTAGAWGAANFAQALAFFQGSAHLITLDQLNDLNKVYVLLNSDVSTAPQMGLIDMDGEVFAYRKLSGGDVQGLSQTANAWYNTSDFTARKLGFFLSYLSGNPALSDWSPYIVQLIGRGLLHSQRRTHSVKVTDGPESPVAFQASWPRLHVVRLPVGPVGLMTEPSTFKLANTWSPIEADQFQGFPGIAAPAILVTEPVPQNPATANMECLALAGPNQTPPHVDNNGVVITPNPNVGKSMAVPWLRGLYNTPQQLWDDTVDGLHPILIGWWPRYASALPSATPTTSATTLTKQHFRSRSYAWVGFPLRLARSRFDQGATFTVKMDPSLAANHALDSLFTLSARAMAGTVNGSATADGALEAQGFNNWFKRDPDNIPFTNTATVTVTNLTNLFNDFGNNEVDGMEVRVTWHYKASSTYRTLDEIAEAMNRAPVIQGVSMTCHAPACVVGVEEK